MLKRQESSLSSSRRQSSTAAATTPPPATHHTKSIGCMSGIIQLFSKYQNPNKRISFGKNQEKWTPPSSPAKSKYEKEDFDNNKVPRSPTLPPEIRRSTAATASSPEKQRSTPSSLVAKLMGLEDIGAAVKTPPFEEDPITEKRRRLLQALEKCNEDLEALKRIIKAVKTTDVRLQPPLPAAKRDNPPTEEGNIPVDTAEGYSRSPPSGFSIVQNTAAGITRVVQQRKPTAVKKPGEDDEPITKLCDKSTVSESSLLMRRRAAAAAAAPPWSSRAMIQSVEEACNDIAWGEKREIGRIGLALQDYLYRELIEEFVNELKSCSIVHHSLPLEACKRRLRF